MLSCNAALLNLLLQTTINVSNGYPMFGWLGGMEYGKESLKTGKDGRSGISQAAEKGTETDMPDAAYPYGGSRSGI